ncbi:quinol dehydrogenase ferredoxin subunit NapH (plasmid) [Azospirillum thermophilum]|uniref:Quinol dehydrogenase ferredoxin subunit NapH n=2 Tax=Azospirillum thermophilum TaxID=2202148 RepID=A0A2S2CYE8_9PROT|nr:quinol dehydrogenase ferredoxin subunit NapH [Azospirillum thermophilum]AWK89542.1 quinol dehydrogenase ferredoxin subunit NapH [Azospirillum thermophilum]
MSMQPTAARRGPGKAAERRIPGRAAAASRGWFAAHRWLIARRLSQLFFLSLFLSGPLFGVWIAKGTLAESRTLDVLPLTDPFVLLQSLLAGHWPETTAVVGAVIVLSAYLLLRGRLYCSWVCPLNLVTDAAAALRRRLGLREGMSLGRKTRLAVLAGVLVASAVTGTIAWEAVNPVTILHRGIVFGGLFAGGAVLAAVAAVFVFDLAVAQRGWCGHLCPVGAFYGLVGRRGSVAVKAPARERCDQCMDCYAVCPEPQVLTPALKGPGAPLVTSPDCTACGRCVDVCPHTVFALGLVRPFARPGQGETP